MEMIYKVFRAEVKGVNADEGTVDLFIPVSTDSVDRDGEIVEPTAFKKTLPKFMKRPVLVASHDYRDLTNQIGEWSKLKIADNGVEGKPKYYINEGNEQADWGFKLASKGMAAFSIGFIPKVWEDGGGEPGKPRRTYKEVELLEISQVIVPSNREAIQSIRSKSVDPIITELCDAVEKGIEPEGILEPTQKPYPNEHACRLQDPGKFTEFRRGTRDHEGKKYSVIFGNPKGGGGWEEQAYRYGKDIWDAGAARNHCKSHDGSFEAAKPEKISQEQIIDELDYIIRLIDTEGMNDEVKKDAWNLVHEVLRIAGSDIPETIVAEVIKLANLKLEQPKPNNGDDLFVIPNGDDILEAIKRVANIGG